MMKFQEQGHLLLNLKQLLVNETIAKTVIFIKTNYFLVPFSCLYKGNWYREREEFKTGPDGCSVCLCVNTEVKCNDETCPRPTTTTTTTAAPPTTTPFVDGPRGNDGYTGDRGDPGERGQPVGFIT